MTPELRDDDTPAGNLRALWGAVLRQALADATKQGGEDRAWVRLANPDFVAVCLSAGKEPEKVVEQFREAERQQYDAEQALVCPA